VKRSDLLPFLAALFLFAPGVALAHATLESSEPAPDATLTQPPAAVRLSFSEEVELDFSLFKVYQLDVAGVDLAADNAWQRLNGLAGALVSDVLDRRDDADARADAGLTNAERRAKEVTIGLRDELAPGVYVVMWRILSIDTHGTQGFLVFRYAPPATP